MKKTIKIMSSILLITILNLALLINTVQAVEQGQINIYTKGEFKRIIKYNGIVVKTANAVYNENGKEYPAYCLNKDLHGVGEYIATYDVTYQGKITDVNLWRVIINGYPYKSIQQLGVLDEGEAYTATKQAIYCHIYNRGTENYSAIGEAGNRVINAINSILENAKKSTEALENQNINIIQDEKWQVEENQEYISKQYKIESNINISKITVSLENQPNGTKIMNLENQEKNEFKLNEKFKILLPISSLEEAGEFKIEIETQMETKPIFYGKAPNADLQDYALTAFSYEDVNTELIQKYEKNETKIIIEKQDSETGDILKGAKFEILNEEKEIILIAETNEKGQIILDQIMPGKYYIKEIQAPEEYEINSELLGIEIQMNEQQILEIKNKKIKIQEDPPEEEKTPDIEVPRLPVTGM